MRQAEIQQQTLNVRHLLDRLQNATGTCKELHPLLNYAHYHRLPKLTLPNFDGDVQTWQKFWDLLEPAVHENCNLTNEQKFSYLKSQLEGAYNRKFYIDS